MFHKNAIKMLAYNKQKNILEHGGLCHDDCTVPVGHAQMDFDARKPVFGGVGGGGGLQTLKVQ